jgi:hypothetical protein
MTTSEKSGCAKIFANLLGTKPKSAETAVDETVEALPYRLRDDFLSPAELNFYRVLKQTVGNSVAICLKVSLGDLFYPKTGNHSENQIYRNRIDRKHVDFLLCDPKTMRPLLGIELDDASHRKVTRQERDRFVEQVFVAAGLPLLRQPVLSAYNTQELSAKLVELVDINLQSTPQPINSEAISTVQKPSSVNRAVQFESSSPTTISLSDGEVPLCPRCNQSMVLRTVKKAGLHYGKQFWGCRDFPRCRGMREYN